LTVCDGEESELIANGCPIHTSDDLSFVPIDLACVFVIGERERERERGPPRVGEVIQQRVN